MKIVSIVGKKNTGKTSLTVKVIEELTNRGYNVASVKHSHHSIEMDKENTDTWKHKQAGSNVVVGVGSTTFFNVRKEMDLNRILFLIKHLDDIDFVIIEGFKRYNYPKIATSPDVVDEYTITEVNSFEIDYDGVSKLADLIEEKGHDIVDTLFANNCGFNNSKAISEAIRNGNLKTEELDSVHSYLSIDGKVIGLNRFVSDYLKQTVSGIIETLNIEDYGVHNIQNIELIIPNNENTVKVTNVKCRVTVNDNELNINKFVGEIVSNSIKGMINSIKTEGEVKKISIKIENIKKEDIENADITLDINDNNVEINDFVQGILKETTISIINSLKIDEEVKTLEIEVEE